MQDNPEDIYCDEHGYSGDYMMDKEQPYFVYSSIAIDEKTARDIISGIKKNFRIQGEELKGSKLIKFNNGRKAILQILDLIRDRAKLSISDKKYALACRFFEYIFEPALAAKNSLFYRIGFHKFISNILYMEFRARQAHAEDIFADFEDAIRQRSHEKMAILFSTLTLPNMSPVLEDVKDFASQNREPIIKEFSFLKDSGPSKWALDLTTSSLFALLGFWGQRFSSLRVFCDASKPLEVSLELFKTMINREDKKYVELGGEKHPLTFNLAQPIALVNSTDFAGIQLADVIAGAYGFVMNNPRDEYTRRLLDYAPEIIGPGSIWPETEKLDLFTFEGMRNAIVLQELVERSRRKIDLLDGIGEFLVTIEQKLLHKE
jgi:hypothetical protein